MELTLTPRALRGTVAAIPSKSQAHRLLLCAAFADRETELTLSAANQDIESTAACLRALGAEIKRTETGYLIRPIKTLPEKAELPCRESGSTLRFLLPVVGALGVDATFQMEGRLPKRPLSPLWEEMERMGCCLSRPTETTVRCQGRLRSGHYRIDGGVSSQFITGLLYALSLLPESSRLECTGKLESAPYIDMTRQALARFGLRSQGETIPGGQHLKSPGCLPVEGDWSNAAFFLGANVLGSQVAVTGLDPFSSQGDRACVALFEQLQQFTTISAADIPDLVPILAVVAGAQRGAVFTDAGRLRLKESDRLQSVAAMLTALGGDAAVTADGLIVRGTGYRGGVVDAAGDHRIAMAAAIAATVCTAPVTIRGAEAVSKSYPGFWADYASLGGIL